MMSTQNADLLSVIHNLILDIKNSGSNENRIITLLKKPLLDNNDLMMLFQKGERTLRRWRKNGIVRYSEIEGRQYYQWEDILETLTSTIKNKVETIEK